jgi:uncharacterized membrane protein
MTTTWERAPAPPSFEEGVYMDVVLRPHRSLSLAAFKLLLAAAIAANLAVALFFMAQGAFPVVGFLGLDVLALWLAFRFNYRAARREERVVIGKHQVYVASRDADGAIAQWVLNPVWARVVREGTGVLIRSGAMQIRLGAFLSPKECETLAAALDGALYRSKRGA